MIQDLAKASFPATEVARRAEVAGIGSVEIRSDLPSALDARWWAGRNPIYS